MTTMTATRFTSTERAVLMSMYPQSAEPREAAERDHVAEGPQRALRHFPSLTHPCRICRVEADDPATGAKVAAVNRLDKEIEREQAHDRALTHYRGLLGRLEDEATARVLDVVRQHPGCSTASIAHHARMASPGPMGDDGRLKVLRALRVLEVAGRVSVVEHGDNYFWTAA